MKSLILSAAMIISVALTANAADDIPENKKVVKTFNEVFKDAQNVAWSNTTNFYEAHFTNALITTRAMFDNNGKLIQTIRYYKENNLPANVLFGVKNDFPNKTVWGITEVSNKNGVSYRIVLQDEKHYTHINANSQGETSFVSKFKRGDK